MTFSTALEKHVKVFLPILFVLCLFISTLYTIPSLEAFQTSDTDSWKEDFHGTPQSKPAFWTDSDPSVKIRYSASGTYAYVSFTSSPSTERHSGSIYYDNIPIDFNQSDTVDIRVRKVYLRTNCKWSLDILDSSDDDFPFTVHQLSGANGLFSLSIKHLSGWEGLKNVSLKCSFDSNTITTHDFVEFDFIRFYTNTSNNYYLWQEDFQIGQPGEHVYNFWDDEEHDLGIAALPTNARIKYHPSGNSLVARMTISSTDVWGKVITPGIHWDHKYFYKVAFNLVAISPDTGCKLELRQLGGSSDATLIGYHYQLGYNEFDLRTLPDWLNKNLPLAIDIVVEGDSSAERYIDIDYIGIYRPKNHIPLLSPTPTPETFPKGGYAIPNPFVPTQGPVQFFTQFSQLSSHNLVKIMNLKGRVVRTTTELSWDGKNDQGNPCEGGIYIYQISSENQRISGKLVLIR